MPYPFTRGVFICGEPLYVEASAGADEMEEARMRLETTLIELTSRADSYFPTPKSPG